MLVLAGRFSIFGTGVAGEIAKVILCIAVSSLRCALVPWLVYHFGLGKPTTIAAGIASTLWIGALETELQGDWDAPITASLLLILIYLHFAKPLVAGTRWRAASLGLLWGIAALFNPTVLQVFAGVLILNALRAYRDCSLKFAYRAIAACIGIGLALFPWALRNRLSLGEFIWTRDTMHFSLNLSYRDGAHCSDPVNTRPSLARPGPPRPAESRRSGKSLPEGQSIREPENGGDGRTGLFQRSEPHSHPLDPHASGGIPASVRTAHVLLLVSAGGRLL